MIDLERVKCNPPREMLAVTSRQTTYPSEYTYREGNARLIFGKGRFVMKVGDELIILPSPRAICKETLPEAIEGNMTIMDDPSTCPGKTKLFPTTQKY